jgi:hypothetical protein
MKEKQIKELLWKYTREDTEIGEERGKNKEKNDCRYKTRYLLATQATQEWRSCRDN